LGHPHPTKNEKGHLIGASFISIFYKVEKYKYHLSISIREPDKIIIKTNSSVRHGSLGILPLSGFLHKMDIKELNKKEIPLDLEKPKDLGGH